MAILLNDERNISIKIEFVNNGSTDIVTSREDNMNWIPFSFLMNAKDESITYTPEITPSFCISEIKYLVCKIKEILQIKRCKTYIKEPFIFISKDYLFEFTMYETKEDDLVYVDWWFNIGSLTNGNVFGYSKGFRFVVTLESLNVFVESLENEFYTFMQSYN